MKFWLPWVLRLTNSPGTGRVRRASKFQFAGTSATHLWRGPHPGSPELRGHKWIRLGPGERLMLGPACEADGANGRGWGKKATTSFGRRSPEFEPNRKKLPKPGSSIWAPSAVTQLNFLLRAAARLLGSSTPWMPNRMSKPQLPAEIPEPLPGSRHSGPLWPRTLNLAPVAPRWEPHLPAQSFLPSPAQLGKPLGSFLPELLATFLNSQVSIIWKGITPHHPYSSTSLSQFPRPQPRRSPAFRIQTTPLNILFANREILSLPKLLLRSFPHSLSRQLLTLRRCPDHLEVLPFWPNCCGAPNLLYKLSQPQIPTQIHIWIPVFSCALFLCYCYSQSNSVYLHRPCTVSLNKVLVCNWSHNPHYCTASQYLEESLPLHQSDPYLKASNLPYISLINSEFPAWNFSSNSLLFIHCFFSPACYSANSLALSGDHFYGKTQLTKMCGNVGPPPGSSGRINIF